MEEYARGVRRSEVDYGTSRQIVERPPSMAVLNPIRPKIEAILGELSETIGAQADTIVKVYYFASDVFTYSWHQDMDFWASDRKQLLNFYIPLHKPSLELTNVSIVPHDVLSSVPGAQGRFTGKGGRMLRRLGPARTEVFEVEDHTRFFLDVDIDSLAVTPFLGAGDLMLLRGDIVHRSQDAATRRIALSVRCACSKSILDRRTLLTGSSSKRRVMEGLADEYGTIFRCFESLGKEEITVAELAAFMDGERAPSVTPAELSSTTRRRE